MTKYKAICQILIGAATLPIIAIGFTFKLVAISFEMGMDICEDVVLGKIFG